MSLPESNEPRTMIDGEESDEGEVSVSNCTGLRCASSDTAYQPNNVLCQLATKRQNFQPQWYKQYIWLTLCTSSKKVYCLYCRYAAQHKNDKLHQNGSESIHPV